MTKPFLPEEPALPYLPYISREISIGNLPLGGAQDIRIQSMTNTETLDTQATVEQCIRMIEAGAELIRITAQNTQAARNLENIKNELLKRNYNTPLIADIHYSPEAAEIAAKLIEKVRINPGNYVDRNHRKFNYDDREYREELLRISERLYPLLDICKKYGTAIRIGTNHGSLSQRIVNRYGDTPLGMAESAMEFVRICHAQGFHKLVLSMKASSIRAMIYATRLLIAKMKQEGFDYPIHLGVTEAGNGEDGRIKSAAGIGTLLMEGIGDTIRVSLTEDPEKEIPVAKTIINLCAESRHKKLSTQDEALHPYYYYKNKNFYFPPLVISEEKNQFSDYILSGNSLLKNKENSGNYKLPDTIQLSSGFSIEENVKENWLIYSPDNTHILSSRHSFKKAVSLIESTPIAIVLNYSNLPENEFKLKAAIDIGIIQSDGLGQAFCIKYKYMNEQEISKLTLDILQACGTRIHKTEFIACPSCGRTQYKIQETLQEIKRRMSHLKGLKIGVMGCIVNGPGEMADADYGYVGSGIGKVTLYKSKEVIRRNIPEHEAIDYLIDLIKENGDWREIE